jgi:hypothetical protein
VNQRFGENVGMPSSLGHIEETFPLFMLLPSARQHMSKGGRKKFE